MSEREVPVQDAALPPAPLEIGLEAVTIRGRNGAHTVTLDDVLEQASPALTLLYVNALQTREISVSLRRLADAAEQGNERVKTMGDVNVVDQVVKTLEAMEIPLPPAMMEALRSAQGKATS